MTGYPKDIAGKRFGRCVALHLTGTKKGTNLEWLCHCDCGKDFVTTEINLVRGDTKSCGCYLADRSREHLATTCVDGTRPCTLSAKIRSDNTSGHKGVSWNQREGKWKAYIDFKGRRIPLGTFDELKDAIASREAAEIKYFSKYFNK